MKKRLIFGALGLLLVGVAVFFVVQGFESQRMDEMNETEQLPPEDSIREPQPEFPQVRVETPEELLDWIRTVDEETFQRGRYSGVVSRLRADGQILMPSFDIFNMELVSITAMQDYFLPDRRPAFRYAFFDGSKRMAVSIRNLNENYFEYTNGNVGDYATMLYGGIWLGAELSETTIQIITGGSVRTETVQILVYSDPDDPNIGQPFTEVMLIVEGFEVMMQQDRDLFNTDFLNLLQLELVAIE